MKKDLSPLDIVTVLYFYAKNFHAYILRLEADFFPDEYQPFMEILKKYYKNYDKVPPKSAMLTECDEIDRAQMEALYDTVFTNINNVKHYAHEYLIEKLDAFAKKNYLRKFLVNSYDKFEQGKFDEIISSIGKLRESIIDNDLGVEYHDDTFIEDRYSNDEFGNKMTTGFKQFDETFGGWHKKSLNIIAGPANSGKTMWLINVVRNRLMNDKEMGNRILYITLEIDKEQVGRRLDCCLTGSNSKDMWHKKDLSEFREMLALSKGGLNNRVMIKEMPGYKTTPADIEACMRNLEVVSDGDLKPNLVVVDYLGLLSPTYKTKNMGLYEKGLEIAVELRAIAQQYNVPFIVAAQTNRNSFSDRAGMDSIADSIGISQTADLMVTINRNEKLDTDGHVQGYLAKSRFSKNGALFTFAACYETMQINDVEMHIPNTKDSEDDDL
jgi:replicative DNA helicase